MTLVTDAPDAPDADVDTSTTAPAAPPTRPGRVRRLFMRPRRVLVKVHRWLGIGLFAWIVVVGLTGAWLAVHHEVESWLDPGRYETTGGDLGPEAAVAAAREALPDDATVYGLTLPGNGRGVYHVYAEMPLPEGAAETELPGYRTVYVDPGSAEVNTVQDEEAGATWWLYRGHMYLWQDNGLFGAFDPETGWCRTDADGHEPGGAKGVACDVLPDSTDLVGWLGAGFIVVLLSGFYLWYWPGVRRWATAFVVKRGRGSFALTLSLHRVIGLVFWVPLTIIAFTGIAFAFPNLGSWFENATPAQRDFALWEPDEEIASGEADGRVPLTVDEAVATIEARYPDRAVRYIDVPGDETAAVWSWVTRGFDPWTREGGAGNTYVALDQYTGETLYDGSPEDGNVFDQAWDDWSFPLHTGDFGGTLTRVLWVAVGLSPFVLGTTGVLMQLQRRAKRRRRTRSGAAATA